jgi:hypothetical protein
MGSWDIAVGIATGYELDVWRVGVRVPVGTIFYNLHVVQTGSGAHLATYHMRTGGGGSPEVKLPGREANHSRRTSAEIKNMWINTFTTTRVSMA